MICVCVCRENEIEHNKSVSLPATLRAKTPSPQAAWAKNPAQPGVHVIVVGVVQSLSCV